MQRELERQRNEDKASERKRERERKAGIETVYKSKEALEAMFLGKVDLAILVNHCNFCLL